MDEAEGILDGLRTFGAIYTELTNRFAAWLGLHATDAAALVEILYAEDKGAPLSPTALSQRLSLTTGATANLLNRLEKLGHVVRTREETDRRKVTVRSAKTIEAPAREFFGPFSERFAAAAGRFSPAELKRFEEFLGELRGEMNSLLESGFYSR
ncbi:MarR family transcriptional regulator [Allokutzneria sp. A3M-2-11 16]|uniref:MarR family winged helix-turn-helix transcriptional regulator n=1 Tax=Allokutzneria sp. A3M-2-11 16 TaxID=2962043 RepID=UPI0020B77B39|nr:MarR family transcriptional regulator [Allokutzneria sp. A3M-2-11 16]MCP3803787.1 MarR family transcriptional regulator [Allokutzneria sp. A3M-2-11 16]